MADQFDKLPQVPQPTANHVIYGGAAWVVLVLFGWALPLAFGLVAAVSVGKKVYDFFHEGESLAMCAGKAVVTLAVPAAYHLLHFAGRL